MSTTLTWTGATSAAVSCGAARRSRRTAPTNATATLGTAPTPAPGAPGGAPAVPVATGRPGRTRAAPGPAPGTLAGVAPEAATASVVGIPILARLASAASGSANPGLPPLRTADAAVCRSRGFALSLLEAPRLLYRRGSFPRKGRPSFTRPCALSVPLPPWPLATYWSSRACPRSPCFHTAAVAVSHIHRPGFTRFPPLGAGPPSCGGALPSPAGRRGGSQCAPPFRGRRPLAPRNTRPVPISGAGPPRPLPVRLVSASLGLEVSSLAAAPPLVASAVGSYSGLAARSSIGRSHTGPGPCPLLPGAVPRPRRDGSPRVVLLAPASPPVSSRARPSRPVPDPRLYLGVARRSHCLVALRLSSRRPSPRRGSPLRRPAAWRLRLPSASGRWRQPRGLRASRSALPECGPSYSAAVRLPPRRSVPPPP